MKKRIVTVTIVVVALLALGIAGLAYAQDITPGPGPRFGPGMMGGGGMMAGNGMMGRGGMMAGWGMNAQGPYGPLHEYMVAAVAEALDMSAADLQAELDAGLTMWDVAAEQGLSQEEFYALMLEARTKALDEAVAAGALTQEQADLMNERHQQMQENGFGPGNCPMNNGGSTGQGARGMMGRGGR
jgi:hypothetical protein